MTIIFKDRKVEVELDRNRDGSRFVIAAYWNDVPDDAPELTAGEMAELDEMCGDQVNPMWG